MRLCTIAKLTTGGLVAIDLFLTCVVQLLLLWRSNLCEYELLIALPTDFLRPPQQRLK